MFKAHPALLIPEHLFCQNIVSMCSSVGTGHGGAAGYRGRRWFRQRRAGSPCWWATDRLLTDRCLLLRTDLSQPLLLPCSLSFPQLVSWTPWPLWVLLLTGMAFAMSLASSIRKSATAGRYVKVTVVKTDASPQMLHVFWLIIIQEEYVITFITCRNIYSSPLLPFFSRHKCPFSMMSYDEHLWHAFIFLDWSIFIH